MPQTIQILEPKNLDARWEAREWIAAVRALTGESQVAVRPTGVETQGESEPGINGWKRRAAKRRFFRGRRSGAQVNDSSYEPAFQAARAQDGALTFEQPEDQLTGRVLPVASPEARWRSRLAITLGTLCTGGFAAAAAVLMAEADTVIDAQTAAEHHGPPTPEKQVMLEVREQTAKVPAAKRAVENFFRAETPEEKAAFVRGGAVMLPALKSYYSSRADEPSQFQMGPEVDFGSDGGREFVFIHGTEALGRKVETIVELTPDGPRLDWRFLTGMGEMEWSDWLRERPRRGTVMRVEAVLDDYYTAPYDNPREWLCLRITDAERTSTAWAYTPRISKPGLTLFRQMNARREPVRLTGVFEFPSKIEPGAQTAP